MTRQDSNSDLAGRLGASLTPRVTFSTTPPRGEQSSGLFDMSVLYAEALDEVMHRARNEVRLGRLAQAQQARWPREGEGPKPLQPAMALDFGVPIPIEFARGFVGPRPRGLGWFGIAVAWLATVTIAGGLATSVPAHALSRSSARAILPAVAAIAPPPEPSSPTALLLVPAPPPAPAPTPPQATVASPAMFPVAAQWLPVASNEKGSPKAPVATAPRVHPRSAPPAPSGVAVLPAQTAPAKPAEAQAPVSTAGISLDDLIRHEVQAEAAKKRR